MKVALKDLYKVEFSRDNDLTFVNGKAYRNGTVENNLTQYLIKTGENTFEDTYGNKFEIERANNIYNAFIVTDKNAIDALKKLNPPIEDKYLNGDIVIDLPKNMIKDSNLVSAINTLVIEEVKIKAEQLNKAQEQYIEEEKEPQKKEESTQQKKHWWNKFIGKEKGE